MSTTDESWRKALNRLQQTAATRTSRIQWSFIPLIAVVFLVLLPIMSRGMYWIPHIAIISFVLLWGLGLIWLHFVRGEQRELIRQVRRALVEENIINDFLLRYEHREPSRLRKFAEYMIEDEPLSMEERQVTRLDRFAMKTLVQGTLAGIGRHMVNPFSNVELRCAIEYALAEELRDMRDPVATEQIE